MSYAVGHLKKKRSHDDSLKCVCLLCFKKAKSPFVLNQKYYDLIDTFVVSGLDKNDNRLPQVICSTCKRVLAANCRGDFSRKINDFDYSKLPQIKPSTRLSEGGDCICFVCQIARTNSLKTAVKDPEDSLQTKSSASVSTLCDICLSEIGRGKRHLCNDTQRRNNLIELLEKSKQKTSEQVVSSTLKKKSSADGSDNIILSQFGRPLRCVLNPMNHFTPQLKLDQILSIHHNLNLSSNVTLSLAKELRYGFRKRYIIEPKLKQSLIHSNTTVDDNFESAPKIFCSKDGDVEETVIFCCDIKCLVEKCIKKRDLVFSKLRFKIGVDGGGGFLKICMNIISEDDEDQPVVKKRRLFKDGPEGEAFKDASVKKLLILALVPDVQENYANVATLWNLLHLEPLDEYGDVKVAADLKLCNIMLGLQNHASLHPCSWCDIEK